MLKKVLKKLLECCKEGMFFSGLRSSRIGYQQLPEVGRAVAGCCRQGENLPDTADPLSIFPVSSQMSQVVDPPLPGQESLSKVL